MAKYPKNKPISLSNQLIRIKQEYKNFDPKNTIYKNNEIKVRLKIVPTPDSDEYIVDIKYKLDSSPRILLISPKLKTFNGIKPHHLYGEEDGCPRLCLYYPKNKEWTKNDYIADKIIPWISTWLFAYEYWLITGKWNYAEITTNKKGKDDE